MIGLLIMQVLRAPAAASDRGRRCRRRSARAGAADSGAERARRGHLPPLPRRRDAFEVVGTPQTVATAIRCVRKGGVVTLVGNLTPEVVMPLQEVVSPASSRCSARARRAASIPMHRADGHAARSTSAADQRRSRRSRRAAWFERLHRADEGLMKVVSRNRDDDLFDLTGQGRARHRREPRARPDFARALARAGADLASPAGRSSRCATVAAEIEALGRRAIPLELDVRDEGSIRRAVDAAHAAFGQDRHPGQQRRLQRAQAGLDVTWDDWNSCSTRTCAAPSSWPRRSRGT